jgi:diazepam-binding inhibitor (GABA receptor modulating acyl-CoA-binding protein)
MGGSEQNLEQEFLTAAENIKISGKNLDNDMLLKLYGYYKQATVGDCNIECPGFWNVKEKAKWEAWEQHKGMKKTHGMKKYVKLVDKILSE